MSGFNLINILMINQLPKSIRPMIKVWVQIRFMLAFLTFAFWDVWPFGNVSFVSLSGNNCS